METLDFLGFLEHSIEATTPGSPLSLLVMRRFGIVLARSGIRDAIGRHFQMRAHIPNQRVSDETLSKTPGAIDTFEIVEIMSGKDRLQGEIGSLLKYRNVALILRGTLIFIDLDIYIGGNVLSSWRTVFVNSHV